MEEEPQITIREFHLEDYEAVIRLWKRAKLQCRPGGRDSRERIARETERDDTVFLVAEIGGELAGTIFGVHDGAKGWISRLAVAPEQQGRGIAGRLVVELQKRLAALEIDMTACVVESANAPSVRLMEKLGFSRNPDVTYFVKRSDHESSRRRLLEDQKDLEDQEDQDDPEDRG